MSENCYFELNSDHDPKVVQKLVRDLGFPTATVLELTDEAMRQSKKELAVWIADPRMAIEKAVAEGSVSAEEKDLLLEMAEVFRPPPDGSGASPDPANWCAPLGKEPRKRFLVDVEYWMYECEEEKALQNLATVAVRLLECSNEDWILYHSCSENPMKTDLGFIQPNQIPHHPPTMSTFTTCSFIVRNPMHVTG